MREIRTFGLMRGKSLRRNRGVGLYVNGTKAGETGLLSMPLNPTYTFQVAGFDGGGSWGAFNGLVRDIGLWGTELKPEQIVETMTARPNGAERKLVGYWPLDDASGNTVRNLKSGGSAAVPAGASKGGFVWESLLDVPALPGTLDFKLPGMLLILR